MIFPRLKDLVACWRFTWQNKFFAWCLHLEVGVGALLNTFCIINLHIKPCVSIRSNISGNLITFQLWMSQLGVLSIEAWIRLNHQYLTVTRVLGNNFFSSYGWRTVTSILYRILEQRDSFMITPGNCNGAYSGTAIDWNNWKYILQMLPTPIPPLAVPDCRGYWMNHKGFARKISCAIERKKMYIRNNHKTRAGDGCPCNHPSESQKITVCGGRFMLTWINARASGWKASE